MCVPTVQAYHVIYETVIKLSTVCLQILRPIEAVFPKNNQHIFSVQIKVL